MIGLVGWLSLVFDRTFVVEKIGLFKPGQQKDSVLCGLFMMNSIRHDALKAPLLDQKGIQAEQVRWFNTLCQTADEAVWSLINVITCEFH